MTQRPWEASRRSLLATAPALALGAAGLAACGDWLVRRPGDRVALAPALSRLRGALAGQLIVPGEAGYDEARRPASFNPDTDKHPAAIALCAGEEDLVRCLETAQRHDLDVAVRGGGHDVLGRSTCEGGLLIDLSLMNAVDVNAERATARVGAGCRVGQLDAVLQDYGLAAALACNPTVGVGGLTLGGGLGWLLGRFGAACDNLEAVELVTADGRRLRASNQENEDLFWALRGGGGNFGVATQFEYRVHALERVTGGYIVYAGAHTPAFLRLYRDIMARAPDELTVEVVIFPSPTPPHHPLLVAVACHSGAPADAERALAPLLRFGPPMASGLRSIPYAEIADPAPEIAAVLGATSGDRPAENAGGGFNYWRGATLSDWGDDALDAFVSCAETAPPGWSIGLGHYMHGAACAPDPSATPLVRRRGSASYFFNIGWGEDEHSGEAMRWVADSIAAMRPFSLPGAYINYLSEETETAVAAAYGANYARLRALKRRYDPDNLFHLNRNIAPAGA